MTYRDRREARADRLRDWAGKREQNAEAVFKAGEPFTSDNAFNTQPGHIPLRSRIIAREDRACESLGKAASMRSRADGIEGQLETSIYDDDPDAVDQLRARITRLEAERDNGKARNAAYRKEHKAELKEMSAYDRGQAMPFPSYYFQNLSGSLSRQRARLALLERTAKAAAVLTASPSVGGVTVQSSGGWTRIQFDDKPAPEIRQGLHDHGFRWNRAGGYWRGTDAGYAATLTMERGAQPAGEG